MKTEQALDYTSPVNVELGNDPKVIEVAAQEHDQRKVEQAIQHNGTNARSDYLENAVFGGLDGIITTFAVVSGVVGAGLDPAVILILGFANLLGDGFSMATGAYLSAKSGQEVYDRERQNMAEEVAREPEQVKEELFELYQGQGYPKKDARRLQEIVSRNPGRWVGALLTEKHLLIPEKRKTLVEAVVTFAAFVVAGSLPLLIYLVALIFRLKLDANFSFITSIVLSGAALFALGAAKVLVTGKSPLRSGLQMLLVGSIAAAVAFFVGAFLESLVDNSF